MKVTRLVLDLSTYGPDKGQYTGYVQFEGNNSETKIRLTPGQASDILAHCFVALNAQADALYSSLLADLKAIPCQITKQPTPTSTTEVL